MENKTKILIKNDFFFQCNDLDLFLKGVSIEYATIKSSPENLVYKILIVPLFLPTCSRIASQQIPLKPVWYSSRWSNFYPLLCKHENAWFAPLGEPKVSVIVQILNRTLNSTSINQSRWVIVLSAALVKDPCTHPSPELFLRPTKLDK